MCFRGKEFRSRSQSDLNIRTAAVKGHIYGKIAHLSGQGILAEDLFHCRLIPTGLSGAHVVSAAVDVEPGAARAGHVIHVGRIYQFRPDGNVRGIRAETDHAAGGVVGKVKSAFVHVVFREIAGQTVERCLAVFAPREAFDHKGCGAGVIKIHRGAAKISGLEIFVDFFNFHDDFS